MEQEPDDRPSDEYIFDAGELLDAIIRCGCGTGVLRVHKFCTCCGSPNFFFDVKLLEQRRGKTFEEILAECPIHHREILTDNELSRAEGDIEYGPDRYCDNCGLCLDEP